MNHPHMSLGDPVLFQLVLTQTYLGLCVVPWPTLRVSYAQYHRIALMVCRHSQGYRLSAIVGSLLFHIHSWVSFIHCSIEHRFYDPCCRTGYVGFSIQTRFLNSVSAVLSLNSLCQFILCINNLLPREVISFGVFYHLFCCLDHTIQSFSMTLCSVILQSFPTFSFSS